MSPVRGELDTLVEKEANTLGDAVSEADDEKFVQVSASAHKQQ